FKLKVEQNLDQPKKFDFENESVLSGIISVLKSGTEDQILDILRMTKQIQNDYLIEAIAGHLTSSSTSIRLETLRNLYFYKSQNYSNKVTLMLEDDSEAIRIEACQYLFEHNPLNSIELLSGYLYHSNIKVRNAALVSLAIETVGNQDLKEILNISLVVKQRIIELAKIDPAEDQVLQNCAIVKTIGHAHLSEHYNYLISMTNDESNEVANEAIISMGRTTEPSFVNLIIAKLSSKKAASASITALTNYGILVHEELIKLLLDSDNELGIRKNLIRVIGEIGNQKSVQVLLNILDDEDYRLRTDSLITLNSLKIKFPYLEFDWRRIEKNLYEEVKIEAETIQVLFVQNNIELSEIRSQNIPNKNPLIESRRRLIQLLNQRQNSGLERIFRLLGLKYPPDDLINIFHGIQRNELDIQINAIEFLDNLLDESSLKKIILLIIESTIMNSISDEFIRKIGKKIPSEYECYEILLNRNDIELAITTLNVISKSRSEKFKNLLIQTEGHKNKKVRKFAKKIHSNFESVD
ncbi:MAG: HEAT repeat domain-containing protein, partial [Bacteroidetes bacterium]|nr:HEAT repeat domain-containing protein [Bacteroidota bacterium]